MPEDEAAPANPVAAVPAVTGKIVDGKAAASAANDSPKDDAKTWDEARKLAEARKPIKSAQKPATAADKPEEAKPADAAADADKPKDTPADKPAEEKPDPPPKAAKAWANLKRKERDLEAKLAKRESELAQQATLVKEAQELAALAASDPLAAARRLGISAKQVIEHGLQHDEDAKLTPEQREIRDLKRWKEEREAAEKKSEENRQQEARENGRTMALTRIGTEFPKVAENYPLVGAMDESARRHEVLAIINRHPDKVLATINGASDPDAGRSLAIQKAFRTLETRLRKEHERTAKAYSESYGKQSRPAEAGNGARSNAGRKTKPEGNDEPAKRGLSNRDAASPSTNGTPIRETAAEARKRIGSQLKLVGQ